MQLVVRNWANFQLHVSHATGNQLQNAKFLVVVVGLVKSLEEVKRPCFAAKLITKHVLLTIVVSFNGHNMSCR